MFKLFDRKKNSFLGIDFGTASIKVTELSLYNQKPKLINYGWVRFDFIHKVNDVRLEYFDDKVKKYLHSLVERVNPESTAAYASIPGFNGLVTLIEFPKMDKKELDEAIQFEAHKHIPTSLDEVSISWDIISKPSKKTLTNNNAGPEKIQVLLVAAPKDKVEKYENLIQSSKLKVEALELETFALARVLVGDDPGTHIIVDIGFRACTIVIIDKGNIKVSRNIDAGGGEITNSIAENLNISKQRAEVLKKAGKDLINGDHSAIVLPTLDLIIGEVVRMINSFKGKNEGIKIDSIVLSGGTSKLKGIDEYFTKSLDIKSVIGNPWKKISYDEKMEPLIKKLGPSFSVSVGLALRGVEEFRRS